MARSTISKAEQERLEKLHAMQERQMVTDLVLLLADPKFLRFYGFLIELCDPMGIAFSLNGSETNYTLGQQEIGKKLWKLLQQHKPEALPLVLSAWNSLEEKPDA